MNITKTSRELTNKEQYLLTKAQNVQKMQNAVGSTLECAYWCLYTDTTVDGEEKELFSMMTPEGEAFATNSPSFIRSFYDILDCFDAGEIHSIKVEQGTSKAGRKYLFCVYVD